MKIIEFYYNDDNRRLYVEFSTDEDEDSFGHQFSDDDLKKFANELGLDYIMESKREEYDDVV